MKYQISLAPSGHLRLHYTEDVHVDIPQTIAGLTALLSVLRQGQLNMTAVKIGSLAMPTQAQMNELVARWQTEQQAKLTTFYSTITQELDL